VLGVRVRDHINYARLKLSSAVLAMRWPLTLLTLALGLSLARLLAHSLNATREQQVLTMHPTVKQTPVRTDGAGDATT
jgi:hypothetical protein